MWFEKYVTNVFIWEVVALSREVSVVAMAVGFSISCADTEGLVIVFTSELLDVILTIKVVEVVTKEVVNVDTVKEVSVSPSMAVINEVGANVVVGAV